jgi:hypothetical protein
VIFLGSGRLVLHVSEENVSRIAASAAAIYPGVRVVNIVVDDMPVVDWTTDVPDEHVALAALYACKPVEGATR